ncbi:uncharacterized protein LDX57_011972 [Aspergillus melleus]|uniref:uncharacterized protein n=1 Tax=Aspergillus melleus TaxID=138277 RepID=UPI001E8E5B3B|nr:uncharacterized protein LDX57_011972 [Aspergillus melleus]KAH8434325.1 hypothetical protein LDX57_011972 [Aspergillus melleus]
MLPTPSLLRLLAFSIAVVAGHPSRRPIVDLGYEKYQAIDQGNETTTYYSFSNIRYASPPVDDLRWKAPVPPRANRSSIQSNPQVITCPQGSTTWQIKTSITTNEYLESGKVPNVSYSNLESMVQSGQEDCLFLDVLAPKNTFDHVKSGARVPVMVWIHGGGFTAGSKTDFGSAKTLVDRANEDGSDPMVYVALNYRLGGFGFLAGSSFEREGGLLNAGLFDQRMALQWIQDNIHLFGGDKNQVTVVGESGGSGSIMHHITAGGNNNPAFQRAILQSPAYFPYRSAVENQNAFRSFMGHANVTSLAEARRLPSDILIAANSRSIGEALPYASPVYSPTPDGDIVLSDPKLRLSRGEFHRSIEIITSHNSDEGLTLVPAIHTCQEYESLLRSLFTHFNTSTINHIVNVLYPPIFDGSMGYTNNYQRAAKTVGEGIIECNSVSLGLAFGLRAHAYYFSTYPGLHAQDTSYTFYNPGAQSSYSLVDTGAVNQTLAYIMQDYIANFAKSGQVKSELDGLSEIPPYGSHGTSVQLDSAGVKLVGDPALTSRCEWWASIDYQGPIVSGSGACSV